MLRIDQRIRKQYFNLIGKKTKNKLKKSLQEREKIHN
jgi:hypothetical protein